MLAAGGNFNPAPRVLWGTAIVTGDDLCAPLEPVPPETLLVAKRGGCLFVEKALHAEAAGARGVILIDRENSRTASQGGAVMPTPATNAISKYLKAGELLQTL